MIGWIKTTPTQKNGTSILIYKHVLIYLPKITGSNHILNLNKAIPKEFKGMTEREFHDKYSKEYQRKRSLRRKKKKQINPDDQLDLGLSLA